MPPLAMPPPAQLLRAAALLLAAAPAVAALSGGGAGGGTCDPETTAPACFEAGDEMGCPQLPGGDPKRCIIHGVTNSTECCSLCSRLSGCNVWTLRTPACHLRRTWQSSRPVPGSCTTGVLSGPLPALPAPQTSAKVTIDLTNITGQLQVKGDRMMGCHTDLGYSNQIRGFYSQLLYGESFENYTGQGPEKQYAGNMWLPIGKGSFSLTTDAPLHGLVAQRITAATADATADATAITATATAGVVNRGYNQEGLSLTAGVGKPWEGYFFARSKQPVRLRVALENYFANTSSPAADASSAAPPPKVLAETTLEFKGGNWTQLPFTLSPTAPTSCRSFPANTPPLWCKLGALSGKGDGAHACLQCSGQLAIYLETAGGTVDLDYAFFQPGPWGRYKGLPLLKQVGLAAAR